MGDEGGTPAGLSRPTYRWLAALPTDPDRLLNHLYAHTPEVPGQERAQTVFDQIGALLGGVTPPRTASALYRAAATMPGVTEAPEAHDAIGRRGVGIARDDTRFGTRTEWVFDTEDLTFLGSRSYLIRDTAYGKSGTLLSSRAEIARGVVDRAGTTPAREPAEASGRARVCRLDPAGLAAPGTRARRDYWTALSPVIPAATGKWSLPVAGRVRIWATVAERVMTWSIRASGKAVGKLRAKPRSATFIREVSGVSPGPPPCR